jgi:hypothetical protein
MLLQAKSATSPPAVATQPTPVHPRRLHGRPPPRRCLHSQSGRVFVRLYVWNICTKLQNNVWIQFRQVNLQVLRLPVASTRSSRSLRSISRFIKGMAAFRLLSTYRCSGASASVARPGALRPHVCIFASAFGHAPLAPGMVKGGAFLSQSRSDRQTSWSDTFPQILWSLVRILLDANPHLFVVLFIQTQRQSGLGPSEPLRLSLACGRCYPLPFISGPAQFSLSSFQFF